MKMVEKLQKRIQEGKKNNKGFSLVELIIVIAIMAILIGIVGMNVIPQIENARKSKDLQVLSAYLTEAMEAYTQNVSRLDPNGTYTIKITDAGAVSVEYSGSVSDDNKVAIENSFKALSSLETATPLKFESKAGSAIKVIVIECKNTSPMITLTCYTNTTIADANKSTDFEVLKSNE